MGLLNDSVMNKNYREQTQFSPEKKDYRKKMGLLLSTYSLSAITRTKKQTNNIFF